MCLDQIKCREKPLGVADLTESGYVFFTIYVHLPNLPE
jgi:hypothetical protein